MNDNTSYIANKAKEPRNQKLFLVEDGMDVDRVRVEQEAIVVDVQHFIRTTIDNVVSFGDLKHQGKKLEKFEQGFTAFVGKVCKYRRAELSLLVKEVHHPYEVIHGEDNEIFAEGLGVGSGRNQAGDVHFLDDGLVGFDGVGKGCELECLQGGEFKRVTSL